MKATAMRAMLAHQSQVSFVMLVCSDLINNVSRSFSYFRYHFNFLK